MLPTPSPNPLCAPSLPHFCSDNKSCNTCPLFTNDTEDDLRAIREAGLQAFEEGMAEGQKEKEWEEEDEGEAAGKKGAKKEENEQGEGSGTGLDVDALFQAGLSEKEREALKKMDAQKKNGGEQQQHEQQQEDDEQQRQG